MMMDGDQNMGEFLYAVAPQVAQLNPPHWSRQFKSDCEAWSCAFAPDDSLFAWSCGNRIVVLVPWDAANCRPTVSSMTDDDEKAILLPESGSCPLTIDCGHIVWAVAITSSGLMKSGSSWPYQCLGDLLLATGLSNSRIRIWDTSNGKLLMELMDHKDVIRDLSFAYDGSLRLASASRDMTLKVWDLKDGGNLVKTLRGHHKWVFGCRWAPNSQLLASVGSDNMVCIWNTKGDAAYTLRHRLVGHTNDVVGCDFSPDSALLATASWDTRIIVWDPCDGHILKIFCHVFPLPRLIYATGLNDTWVRGVRFSSNGSRLASIADDGFVRFWDPFGDSSDPIEVAPLEHSLCCSYSSSGHALAVCTRDGSVSFFRSPSAVQSLKRICRRAVRLSTTSEQVQLLDIPRQLHEYLRYREWS